MQTDLILNFKPIFDSKSLAKEINYLAPDTSEIRLLCQMDSGGFCHCTLPPGKVSSPVKHKTVSELWYCVSGSGEIWQARNGDIQVMKFTTGDSFTIPVGNAFQFRNTGDANLCVLIATIPKWPGANEAEPAKGYW